MKHRVIIVEDEPLSADRLHAMLKKQQSLRIETVLNSVAETKKWLAENDVPDLLFLDIQLGDGTGLDILNELTSFPQVIFTTAFDQYIMDAFKYNSIDYLLKPIKEDALVVSLKKFERLKPVDNFHSALAHLETKLTGQHKRKFLVKIGLQLRSVPVEEIGYFYSKDGGTYIKTAEGKSLIIDHTLDELDNLLDPKMFFRINRHLVVKFEHISSIETYFNHRLILKLTPEHDQETIVSRDKVKAFKNWLDN